MDKQELINAFQGKILGIRNYKSDKKEFFTVDFTDPSILADCIIEFLTGESDITPAGKSFLEKYYGFDTLALNLSQNEQFRKTHAHVSAQELQGWLEGLDPMEAIRFIEESRGNIQPGVSLRADLLPPENI